MSTLEELNQEIQDLRQDLTDATQALDTSLQLRSEETEEELLKLSHQMRMGVTPSDDYDDEMDDEMDVLINSHLRDITAEQRPQMSSAGLETYNKHFTNLTNHELHQINKMKKTHSGAIANRTIMDETMGDIVDNCINFLTYSFENYTKKIYESEELMNKYEDRSLIENIQMYSIAILLFIRDDQNIIYIGFILILFSIIIYFTNIFIS